MERGRTILERILGIDRAAAGRALRRAGNNLKVAILMERLKLERAAAEQVLARHRDNLAAALREWDADKRR